MLMKDGRIGLIDYGQVKKMSLENRIRYAQLIIAVDNGDVEEVARIQFHEFGARSKYLNPNIIYKLTAFWNDRDTDDITEGMNLQQFLYDTSLHA